MNAGALAFKVLDSKIGTVLIGGVVVYALWKLAIAPALGKAKDAVDPTSANNLAYQATTGAVRAVTGNSYDTLGTWLYSAFNRDPFENDPTIIRRGPGG